jgi:hypothetical protein
MSQMIKRPVPPKMEMVIDNGIFDPIIQILVKLGLCHQKERIQAEHPNANVRYQWEYHK